MKDKICPICNNHSHFKFRKETSYYFQCTNCKTLFCDPIDQEGMVGGEFEEGRNIDENHIRISRIAEMSLGIPKEELRILDFGCGHGMMLNDLKDAGYINAIGYDAYNPEYNTLPITNQFHVITAIEVIEHTSSPFIELNWMYKALAIGGCVMLETSFVDIANEEGIPLDKFFYVAPQNGHSTIFSHHGLDLLMTMKGFIPKQHFNRNVRLYQKIK
jgi:hypothetical protein